MSAKRLVSIVDDDDSARESVVGLVKALGFVVAGFRSAAEFLRSRDMVQTACLIADVQMPDMTGLELHLFLVASGAPIPTILITAFPSDTSRQRALDAGVQCYLTKPLDVDRLLSCIRTVLSLPRDELD